MCLPGKLQILQESGQHWFRYWLVTYPAPSHYLNQCWVFVNWTLRNKLQWNFHQNTKLFIHENASENIVCEMVAILSRGRWVKATFANFFIRGIIDHSKISIWSFGLNSYFTRVTAITSSSLWNHLPPCANEFISLNAFEHNYILLYI